MQHMRCKECVTRVKDRGKYMVQGSEQGSWLGLRHDECDSLEQEIPLESGEGGSRHRVPTNHGLCTPLPGNSLQGV
jgi:hypothetical protein